MSSNGSEPTMIPSKPPRITAKQLSFARQWVKLFLEEAVENDTEAYRRSDYASDGFKDNDGLVHEANRIREHPNVAPMIDQMLSDAIDMATLDQANVIATYVRQRDVDLAVGKLKESIEANDRLARIVGVGIDPAHHAQGAGTNVTFNILPPDVLDRLNELDDSGIEPKAITGTVIDVDDSNESGEEW